MMPEKFDVAFAAVAEKREKAEVWPEVASLV
jgi:hypothetical protein